jgi:HPt (histidine-containing phosphotransfer) domain-containing protein
MTAYAMKGDQERCLEAGMDGYVSKPLRAQELFATLEALVPNTPLPQKESPAAQKEEEIREEVLDRSELWSRVDGNVKILRNLLGLFSKHYPRLLSQIQEAVAKENPQALTQAAHTLKGVVGTFAAKRAFEAARKLETLGRQGDLCQAKEALVDLEKELSRLQPVLATLEEELASSPVTA